MSIRDLFLSPTVSALAGTLVAREARPGRAERAAALFQQVFQMSDAAMRDLVGRRGGTAAAGTGGHS
jgi:hypothetical protein